VIIYDPLATMDTPIRLWLASGVMAIDHTVEVVCSSPPHPVGDTLKLAAARELISNLPLTRQTPTDANARLRCQIAAWMADHSPLRAQPLTPAATALPSHALAYELGALCRVSYGIVACVILPAALRWTAARNSVQAAMARALGLAAHDGPDAQAAGALADGLARFIASLDLPARLADSGVGREDLAKIAHAFAARGASLNGNEPATAAEVIDVLESAW
jgi:alcohol dehydrogenase class IV